MKKLITLTIITAMACISSIAGAESLKIEGSTTVGPIADAFAEYFKSNLGISDITVTKNGSGNGAAAIADGRADIGIMSRFMKDKEFKACVDKGIMPVAHVVAMDGVCVVVHPSNPVKSLTIDQVRDIYTGKITNWRDLGGPNLSIVCITRDSASGTFETFEGLVMHKEKMNDKTEEVASNPQMHARISTTKGAIGYVGLGFVDYKVSALTINGVKPTRKTISSGAYPISRPLYMFTNGYPKLGSAIHKFVSFNLSEEGQEIIETKGFVPLTDY